MQRVNYIGPQDPAQTRGTNTFISRFPFVTTAGVTRMFSSF
jgi:hypothetical protein